MTFPLDCKGEIYWKGPLNAKERFLTLMPIELRNLGLQQVFVQGDRISFGRGIPRYLSRWNILTALDKGDIEVLSKTHGLVVVYRLSFQRFFILMSVVLLAALITWSILGKPPISVVIGVAVAVLGWSFLMALSFRAAARRFALVIQRLLATV